MLHRPGVVREGVHEEMGQQPGRKFSSSDSIIPTEMSKDKTAPERDKLGSRASRLVAMNFGKTDGDKWMPWGHRTGPFQEVSRKGSCE